jgi:hypothetical protein
MACPRLFGFLWRRHRWVYDDRLFMIHSVYCERCGARKGIGE